VNSYQLFYGAIKEQAEGLVKTNTIDAFFAVPAQAFQTDFNDNYARYQQASEKQAMQGRQSLMRSSGCKRCSCLPRCCCSPLPLSSGSACPMGDYAAASSDCAY
jgi:hypothetical protein